MCSSLQCTVHQHEAIFWNNGYKPCQPSWTTAVHRVGGGVLLKLKAGQSLGLGCASVVCSGVGAEAGGGTRSWDPEIVWRMLEEVWEVWAGTSHCTSPHHNLKQGGVAASWSPLSYLASQGLLLY